MATVGNKPVSRQSSGSLSSAETAGTAPLPSTARYARQMKRAGSSTRVEAHTPCAPASAIFSHTAMPLLCTRKVLFFQRAQRVARQEGEHRLGQLFEAVAVQHQQAGGR